MMPGRISQEVVADRLNWIDRMLSGIRMLPLDDREEFFSDTRNLAAAESYLRRALESLSDLGRHILAKGFGVGVMEYKDIALRLQEMGILSPEDGTLLAKIANYRNRLVHFYHEVEPDELYSLCRDQLVDIERITNVLRKWINEHVEPFE
jgi:uncharacterized protein YutE (UPF0331/DUF86 family)